MFTEKEMSDALKWLFDLFQPEDYEAYDEEEVGCAALCLPEVCMALRDKAETPYEYVVKTNIDRGFEYRGKELFMQRACLIYSDMEIGIYDMTDTSYNRELWLLEDMSFALVHNVSMVIKSGDFYYAMVEDTIWSNSPSRPTRNSIYSSRFNKEQINSSNCDST